MPTRSIHPVVSPRVEAFLDAVEALPAPCWLDAGSRDELTADDVAVATATLLRDAAIADRALDYAAWLVRDAIATLAWLAERRLGPLPAHDRLRVTRAAVRFERAALALLVADALPLRDLRALCSAIAPTLIIGFSRASAREPAWDAELDAS